MSDVILARLARLERDILAIVKTGAQAIPIEISAFVLDRMDFTTAKKTVTGGRKLPRNSGSRLRTLYGNLTRALTPGGKGNVSNIIASGSNVVVEFGFDPATQVKQGPRTGDLRYGVLHEFGGTINHPGGTAYFTKDGQTRFVSNPDAAKYFAKTKRELPRTKPHSIGIRARPYLGPGFADYMNDPTGFSKFMDELLAAVKIRIEVSA